jgi:hypothetical protein
MLCSRCGGSPPVDMLGVLCAQCLADLQAIRAQRAAYQRAGTMPLVERAEADRGVPLPEGGPDHA